MDIRALLLSAQLLTSAGASAQKFVVGYVPNWDDLAAFTKTLDFDKLTHVNIAFENPVDDDGNLSFAAADAPLIEAAHRKHCKVLVSMGGGSAAEDKVLKPRMFALLSEPKRAGFVSKIAAYLKAHDLDGIDVDIEGPSINEDYGAFIHDLASALKPQGKLVSAALSQGYGGDKVPNSALTDFDFVNIMAYDATGPWNPNAPGQHSSLEFAKSTLDYWAGRGLPKAKTVLGLPFYGYGFGSAVRGGEYSFAEIVKTYPGAENADQVGDTIWYNGIPTIRAKVALVKERDIAGVMIWELTSDAPGDKSLLNAIYKAFRG